MSAVQWNLQIALFETLSAYAPLRAELGDPPRIYDDPPQGAALPYLVIGEGRASDYPGLPGGVEHDIRIAAFSRHGGRQEIKRLLDLVIEALHEAEFEIEGARLAQCRFVFADAFRRRDNTLFEGLARFRAVTETLNP